jgi:hypothetical protein
VSRNIKETKEKKTKKNQKIKTKKLFEKKSEY